MPYRSSGNRRNSVQFGVGRSIWTGSPPPAIPEQVLDGIPGFLAWVALLLTAAGAVLSPRVVVTLAALLGFYTALRFIVGALANLIGLRRVKRWEDTDWRAEYQRRAGPDSLRREDVMHVVLIPAYKEPEHVLVKTLESLARQENSATQMAIVLAMEAADPNAQATAEILRDQFRARFKFLYYTIHPKGLPGEMQCKSANEAWAARWIKRRLVDEKGYNIEHIVVTTMDADTLWHPSHFACLTTLFALNPDRDRRFWQAPIRYHSNIWDIDPTIALVHAYSSAWELAYLSAPGWIPLPMSSYALSLRLLEGVGYWDSDVIADEWHMFIKAFFQRDSQVKLERVYLPFYAEATAGNGFLDSLKNRYQQSLRHAWGSKEVGFTLARIIEHPELRVLPGLRMFFRVAHDIILAGAGWVIMTVGPYLVLMLYPQLFFAELNTAPFLLLQISLSIVSVLGFVFWVIDISIRPPRPRPWSLREVLLTLISFPLLPVMMLVALAIPTIQAQTQLMLGMPIQFKVTKKV
jgi:cellulose synthase/poly-beta-1,6-N-acetylglucosamine synthase-like glycosyltransferase